MWVSIKDGASCAILQKLRAGVRLGVGGKTFLTYAIHWNNYYVSGEICDISTCFWKNTTFAWINNLFFISPQYNKIFSMIFSSEDPVATGMNISVGHIILVRKASDSSIYLDNILSCGCNLRDRVWCDYVAEIWS